jgi:hypothetical protein
VTLGAESLWQWPTPSSAGASLHIKQPRVSHLRASGLAICLHYARYAAAPEGAFTRALTGAKSAPPDDTAASRERPLPPLPLLLTPVLSCLLLPPPPAAVKSRARGLFISISEELSPGDVAATKLVKAGAKDDGVRATTACGAELLRPTLLVA